MDDKPLSAANMRDVKFSSNRSAFDTDKLMEYVLETYKYEKYGEGEPAKPKPTPKQIHEEKEKLYGLCDCGSGKKFKFCCRKK